MIRGIHMQTFKKAILTIKGKSINRITLGNMVRKLTLAV